MNGKKELRCPICKTEKTSIIARMFNRVTYIVPYKKLKINISTKTNFFLFVGISFGNKFRI